MFSLGPGDRRTVRVGREALELLGTGRIVFLLVYAPEFQAIRRGEVGYEDVAARIERLVAEVEAAAVSSSLRDKLDQGFIDGLVARAYRERVLAAG